MKKLLTLTATIALCAMVAPAHADGPHGTETYRCRSNTLTINWDNKTMIWRGKVFHNLEIRERCMMDYQATDGNTTAELCVANNGAGDLTIHGVESIDCHWVR